MSSLGLKSRVWKNLGMKNRVWKWGYETSGYEMKRSHILDFAFGLFLLYSLCCWFSKLLQCHSVKCHECHKCHTLCVSFSKFSLPLVKKKIFLIFYIIRFYQEWILSKSVANPANKAGWEYVVSQITELFLTNSN